MGQREKGKMERMFACVNERERGMGDAGERERRNMEMSTYVRKLGGEGRGERGEESKEVRKKEKK
jgi:hypothetical protein